jgi:hypothetical protein
MIIATMFKFRRKFKMLRWFRICLKRRIWSKKYTSLLGSKELDGYR